MSVPGGTILSMRPEDVVGEGHVQAGEQAVEVVHGAHAVQGAVTPGWAMVNAIARWVRGGPASAARGMSFSTASSRRSSLKCWNRPARRRSLFWCWRTRPVSSP